MYWFAVSSKFYLDMDDAGISERGQMLALRAMAYCADNETTGVISKAALNKLGLTTVSRRLHELLRDGMMVETEDKRSYFFPAWLRWQEPMEAQVRKNKRDRETLATKRAESRNVVRQKDDTPTTVATYKDKYKNKETLSPVESTPHVPAVGEETPGRKVPVDGWKVVRANTPDSLGSTVRSALSLEVSMMLRDGATEQQAADCVLLWMQKPDAGVKLLPHLLANVVKGAHLPGTNQGQGPASRPSKSDMWASVGDHLRGNQNTNEALELEA